MLSSIMATHPDKWDTYQGDVKKAFLNRKLKEVEYVEHPLDSEVNGNEVLKRWKTLYGLSQSPREWHAVLLKGIELLGLSQSTFDTSVFINKNHSGIIIPSVDDLGTFFSDPAKDKRVAEHLAQTFWMTDNCKISWIVGIQITYSNSHITLGQAAYVQQTLEHFNMIDC